MSSSIVSHPSTTMKSDVKLPMAHRAYQAEIAELAKKKNLIVCLPTGSGKTFIAIQLIKEFLLETQPNLANGGKRTVFLVKTRELARQHYNTLKESFDEPELGLYYGDSSGFPKDSKGWSTEFEKHRVLIFTAQIFLDLLVHGYFSLNKVNLLIFDECHHSTGNDTYNKIMSEHYENCRFCPRILGLTASITGQKIGPEKLKKVAKELESTFHARIETGSDPLEIAEHSTSAKVSPQLCKNYKTLLKIKEKNVLKMFNEIQVLSDELEKKKKSKNPVHKLSAQSDRQTNTIELDCRTFDQLKSHLDNILHIGYELGLFGFSLGIKALQNYLETRSIFLVITDQTERELYNKVIDKLVNLTNNQLANLTDYDEKILFSDKVLKVAKNIQENSTGQTIVFVDRVYTAAFFSQVLGKLPNSITAKYLAGSSAKVDGISVSPKYQQNVVSDFRNKVIRVLIATAIIEEGMDISECNLVIRFNKPQNFSSYLQSKGRARAKDATFVILHDEAEVKEYSDNKEEYGNYKYMEKMLKNNFNTNDAEDVSSDNNSESLLPYTPGNGVRISGTDAVRILYQYCAVLGNGQMLSPRFCFYLTESNQYQCVLSMPRNCPIKDDITVENRSKKVAKQGCCLQMVERLHKEKELDDSCMPIRRDEEPDSDDSSDEEDNKKDAKSLETVEKQISRFPIENFAISTQWHLYRAKISFDIDLGFVVPNEISKLPIFKLYATEDEYEVEIVYVKSIDFKQYKQDLEAFCRYIFEDVFENIVNKSEPILKFDIEQSPFKLLPCFLDNEGNIDRQRMASVCGRKNKRLQSPSELNESEVYIRTNSQDKSLFTHNPHSSYLKRTSDPWKHDDQSGMIKTYIDHFKTKSPDIHIQADRPMLTATSFQKPRINYFRKLINKNNKKAKGSIVSSGNGSPIYFPVEFLGYAPLNENDYELIYKIPSLTVRISQLSYVEQLRKLLANNIQSYRLLNAQQVPIVSFLNDLPDIFVPGTKTVLPFVRFNYDLILNQICPNQPTPDLLFKAITRHSTAEEFDMENLEILGDCFLKLAMSMSLYHQYPESGSGKLTSIKDWQVSNINLLELATKRDLKKYLYKDEVRYSGKDANWIPPGYTATEPEYSERYCTQKAKGKAFADMMEALIGAFLISSDYGTTIRFMDWLGLKVIPKDKQGQIMKTPSIFYSGISETTNGVVDTINSFFQNQNFTDVEKTLKYTFKNKAYLVAAFTHPSYYNNRTTQCYERLEYLGDAVLDFLVIRCVFVEHYKYVTPSQVTSIRQDLSNNGRLANRLVYNEFHKKILHTSSDLHQEIHRYLESHDLQPNQTLQDKLNNDIHEWADSTAPKALADVFEALVGAIFLDSGYSLETVWQIIQPLFQQYISQSVQNPNLNPIRSFYENGGKILQSSPNENGGYVVRVQLPEREPVSADAKNKRIAKYKACRRAMDELKF